MQIERRDQSKKIQKGDKGGQKKITTESLRRGGEGKGGKKGGDQQGGQRGDGKRNKKDRKKGGKFGKNKKEGRGKPMDADALDKELEGYWVKNGDTALGKYTLL